jgi:hypothetical protein
MIVQSFLGSRWDNTPPWTATVWRNPVRGRRVLSVMKPASKGLVRDLGILCNGGDRPVWEDRLREVVEDGSNVSKLVMSMRELEEAFDV